MDEESIMKGRRLQSLAAFIAAGQEITVSTSIGDITKHLLSHMTSSRTQVRSYEKPQNSATPDVTVTLAGHNWSKTSDILIHWRGIWNSEGRHATPQELEALRGSRNSSSGHKKHHYSSHQTKAGDTYKRRKKPGMAWLEEQGHSSQGALNQVSGSASKTRKMLPEPPFQPQSNQEGYGKKESTVEPMQMQ